ncbi:hypothetical protein [Dactylosporangium matsuzakiense]|nr:hypothetical protein [Dactylosporangium matsuzakiense]
MSVADAAGPSPPPARDGPAWRRTVAGLRRVLGLPQAESLFEL